VGAEAEGAGDFYQSVQTGGFFAALDFADEVVVEVGFFGEAFEAQSGSPAIGADGSSDNFTMFESCRHRAERKQERGEWTTVDRR
jgi:hypothetical protein